LHEPLATHYIEKVIRRVQIQLEGLEIGSMFETDYENVPVDEEFELLRQNLEVPSTLGEEEREPTINLMSVRSYELKRKEELERLRLEEEKAQKEAIKKQREEERQKMLEEKNLLRRKRD
jgi:hypothetical protein